MDSPTIRLIFKLQQRLCLDNCFQLLCQIGLTGWQARRPLDSSFVFITSIWNLECVFVWVIPLVNIKRQYLRVVCHPGDLFKLNPQTALSRLRGTIIFHSLPVYRRDCRGILLFHLFLSVSIIVSQTVWCFERLSNWYLKWQRIFILKLKIKFLVFKRQCVINNKHSNEF